MLADFKKDVLKIVICLLPPSTKHVPYTFLETVFYFLNCQDLGLKVIPINLWAADLAKTL